MRVDFLDPSNRERVDVIVGEDTNEYLKNLAGSMSFPSGAAETDGLLGFSDTISADFYYSGLEYKPIHKYRMFYYKYAVFSYAWDTSPGPSHLGFEAKDDLAAR